MYEKVSGEVQVESLDLLRAKATDMLDRVKVMRVFDFAGMIEAITEVGELCLQNGQSHREVETTRVLEIEEVANSEDEEDEITILDDPEDPLSNHKERVSDEGLGMILIDSIATLVSTEMSKNQTEGLDPFQ